MGSRRVRRGVTQAQFNRQSKDLLPAEVAIISIALGIIFWSWSVFGVAFFGLLLIIAIKPLAMVFVTVMSILWAVVIALVAFLIGGAPAAIVLGLMGFCYSFGAHLCSLEYYQDLG